MAEFEQVYPSQLRAGPIRHDSLPPRTLAQIREVHRAIGPYLDTTLEQFEVGFTHDAAPEREVAVWRLITLAWIVYHERYLGNQRQADAEERKLVGALLLITMGVEDVERLSVPVDVGNRLFEIVENLRRGGRE